MRFHQHGSLIGTYHKIASFRDMTIRTEQFMQPFLQPIVLIDLSLFQQAKITLLVQPGVEAFQDSHIKDEILELAMFMMRLGTYSLLSSSCTSHPTFEVLNSLSSSNTSNQGHLSGHEGWYQRSSRHSIRWSPQRPTVQQRMQSMLCYPRSSQGRGLRCSYYSYYSGVLPFCFSFI